jgi:asparagine synthase (glutamine-hydrolysing)
MVWYMRNQLLRDVDWASMAHSVEVRVPLVDVQLFRAIAPLSCLSNAPTKAMMAEVPNTLPETILKRRKTGFSIPVRDWLVQDKKHPCEGQGLRRWAMKVMRECH